MPFSHLLNYLFWLSSYWESQTLSSTVMHLPAVHMVNASTFSLLIQRHLLISNTILKQQPYVLENDFLGREVHMLIPSQASIQCSQLSAASENFLEENEEVCLLYVSARTQGSPYHPRGRGRRQARDTVPVTLASNDRAGRGRFFVSSLF